MKKIMNERLTISTADPVRARMYDYERFTYPWHFHEEYEILYVEEGYGSCLVGDSVVPYGAGDVFFFGSGLPHCMQNPAEYDMRPELRVKGSIIQFEKGFMHYSVSQYTQFAQIRNMLDEAVRGLKFSFRPACKTVRLLRQIPAARGAEQIILLLSLLQRLSVTKEKRFLATSHYTSSLSIRRSERMEKVMNYLNKHYAGPVRLTDAASCVAMSPSAFCRYFKENTGKTFLEYVYELRIGYACKLLTGRFESIGRVALLCGFESTGHFNRIFKRVTGLKPTAYRAQMK